MSAVVADTGPIHYLVLTQRIFVLPLLFECIFIPKIVREELLAPKTPDVVRKWILAAPDWLQVRGLAPDTPDPSLTMLDVGEQEAIRLAIALQARLLLIDDRAGARVARERGLLTTGTLGVLDLAAKRGLVDMREALGQLTATNFRYPQALIDLLLEAYSGKQQE